MSIVVTQEIFENKIKETYNDLFIVVGKYISAKTPIDIRCNKCGCVFSRIPNNITGVNKSLKCPSCHSSTNPSYKVVVGLNDMWTTRPDVALLLKNKEDGYKYTCYSKTKLTFICPKCGSELIKTPSNVSNHGLSCNYCSDGISYPNRFMSLLLQSIGIRYSAEYTLYGFNHRYRYDFRFEYDYKKYLLEMDGGFGHGYIDTPCRTIDEQIEDDHNKDVIAIENGYTLIRIDCKYNSTKERFHYIAGNILNSEFKQFIPNYTLEDLIQIDRLCNTTSFVVDVANDWNMGINDYSELSKKNNVSKGMIRSCIKKACYAGLINNTYDECLLILRKSGQTNRREKQFEATRVICNETQKVYRSLGEARSDGYCHVWDCLKGKREFDGTLSDGTKLTWKEITEEEYQKLKSA